MAPRSMVFLLLEMGQSSFETETLSSLVRVLQEEWVRLSRGLDTP